MRYLRRALILSLLLIGSGTFLSAQEPNLTDAQRMDLAGHIKAISTTASRTDVPWQQPAGPNLIVPVFCWECEFDANGNQTRSGQMFNGSFHGEFIRLVVDGQGHVTERVAEDASTGDMVRHDLVGPFGKTQQSLYKDGELQYRVLLRYDEYGHTTEWRRLDAAGNQLDRTVVNTDKDGNDTEQWDWREDAELSSHFRHTFDPKTKSEQFASFDSFGNTKLTWSVAGGKLVSFWELPDLPRQYGEGFSEDSGNDTFETYACRGGACELSRVHYVYLDAKRRNPQRVEWRDESGNLRYAAYYEYEIDAQRNWTQRKIWVWSASLGEPSLYETDSRAISYWSQ
jgi:hypothetical protein